MKTQADNRRDRGRRHGKLYKSPYNTFPIDMHTQTHTDTYTHTHTHTHTHIYIYIYMCVCVGVCLCYSEKSKIIIDRKKRMNDQGKSWQ